MSAFIVVTTLISVLLNAGISLKQLHLNWKNQKLRDAVMNTVSSVTKSLKSGKLKAAKLINALQTNNTAALQQYLYANPLVGKSLEDINKDSQLIADIQASVNHWESVIAQLESELQSLGYSQSHSGTYEEEAKYAKKKAELDSAVDEYNKAVESASNTRVSANRDFKVDTSHLDAVSQNIAGGIQNA